MNVALRPDHGAGLDFISLCTGGGGLDLGVELAMPDARAVCMVEREAFAVAHLVEAMRQGLMAPAPVWSDARTFDGRAWRGCVDGVVGGIPCQPHSLAGKRRGEDDERDLWSAARRIIVQSGAWWVLIENVAGMLSSGGAERVWRDLQRLGFAVEGGLFTASEVGAPHQRERVFILGVADANGAGRRQPGCGPARRRSEKARRIEPGRLGGALGHTDRAGSSLDPCEPNHSRPQCATVERDDWAVVEPESFGLGQGRSEHELSERHWIAASLAGIPVADTPLARGRPIPEQPRRCVETDADADRAGLFPPGPGDAAAWAAIAEHAPDRLPALSRHDRFRLAIRAARLAHDGDPLAREGLDPLGPYGLRASVVSEIAQSALRGVADGLASRVDELRMLGNGVVSVEAAYALRTLVTRLARRSGAAGQLSRMMD